MIPVKKMNEQKAVAIMMANLKSKKKPSDIIEFALACRYLKELWGIPKMATYFNTSQYMLRQIDRLNDLDSDTKQRIIEEDLGIEASYHLSRLDLTRRHELVGFIKKMKSDEIRTIVQLLLHDKNLSVHAAQNMTSASRTKEIKLLVLPLENEIYERIKRKSGEEHLRIHDFVLKILEENI